MTTFIGSAPVQQVTAVVANRLTASSAINGVGAGNNQLVDTIPLPSFHNANTAYRLLIRATMTGIAAGNTGAVLRLQFVNGANNSAIDIGISRNLANGTVFALIDIFPADTTAVNIFLTAMFSGAAIANALEINTSSQMAGGGTWAAQTAVEMRGYVASTGSFVINAYTLEAITK